MNYRMTVYPAVEAGNPSVKFMFETAEQMVVARDTTADLLLFIQDQTNVMANYSNMFVLEEFVGAAWEEYEEF